MKILFKNPVNNSVITAPVGFSWRTLFFYCWDPLLRGDVKYFFVMLIVLLPSLFLSWLIYFPICYNEIYIKNILKQGYVPGDEKAEKYLKDKKLII